MSDRQVEIAEHLWTVLEAMARDMGTDTRSLVNQAVFNWARRNGYPVVSMALAAMDTPSVREPTPPVEPGAPIARGKAENPWDVETKDHPSGRFAVLPVPAPEPPVVGEGAVEARRPMFEIREARGEGRGPTSEGREPNSGNREPENVEPQAAKPTTEEPRTAEPKAAEPQTAKPKTVEPKTAEPSAAEPQTAKPDSAEPKPAERRRTEPMLAPRPLPVADEATRAIDPDSPAAAVLRPRDPTDEASAARNATAARIVAIDRALDDVLPTPGRLSRARMSSGEIDNLIGERSPAIDTSPTPIPHFTLELRVEGTEEIVAVEAGPFIIGRARHCGLIIESPQVSREHAVITKVGASYLIEDRNSSNGTFVGDDQIQRHELRDGDICRIGTATVIVSIRAAEAH